MRRAVAVAIATGVSTLAVAAPASAGSMYMGVGVGPSSSGGAAGFDAAFDDRGHATVNYVMGWEVAEFTLDLRIDGAGYSVRGAPAPSDTVLMWFGGDVGKRVWVAPRLALGATIGMAAAKMVKWTEDDMVAEKLLIGGTAWGLGARLEYVIGRGRPTNPDYHGPIKFFDATFVLEARREHMFLSSSALRTEPTITTVTAGLRVGMSW
jgi:hypothetical protein